MIGGTFHRTSAFAALDARVRAGMARNATAAADVLEEAVIENIGIEGPPRSLAGQFPHIDTGRLIESWSVSTADVPMTTYLWSDDPAAYFLEVGRKQPTVMEPRPILIPSIEGARGALAREFGRPV